MNLTHAPKVVQACLETAKTISEIEARLNSEYRYHKNNGKSIYQAKFKEYKDKLHTLLKSFKRYYQTISELYPEYLSAIPKVHLPICKR